MTLTKVKVVTIQVSMLPRQKQIESSDLKFGTCIDELVPALRAGIKKLMAIQIKSLNGNKKKLSDTKKKPRSGASKY